MLYRPKGLMGTMEITDYFKFGEVRKEAASMTSEPLLKVKDVGIQFGGLKAVSDLIWKSIKVN